MAIVEFNPNRPGPDDIQRVYEEYRTSLRSLTKEENFNLLIKLRKLAWHPP